MSRDKNKATPKQNKWNDPFYAKARCGEGRNYTVNYGKWIAMKIKRSPFK